MSHPTITYIFAGDHAQTRAIGKGIKFKGCFVYLDMYIAKMYRSAFASAYFNCIVINGKLENCNRSPLFLTMLGDSFLTWLVINYP